MTLAISPGERRTAHELVRDTLRRAILTGQIPGGQRLVQADLAKQLEVSTTPVREALRDLSAEGLIDLDAHRGAIVRSLSKEEVEEIYWLRQLLEPELMGRAVANITDEQIAQAEAIQKKADKEKDPAAWVELNKAFHRVFNVASNSPRLASIVENLQDSGTAYVLASLVAGSRNTTEANAQHREILAAVRSRDVRAAKKRMRDHVHKTLAGVPELARGS
ncbi:MAG TPA: GntR family transcriptional regulator [Nocardioidaceae bacterium]|nr:GntR family transcriptional regulator [Nocardioidaceae bacterium]